MTQKSFNQSEQKRGANNVFREQEKWLKRRKWRCEIATAIVHWGNKKSIDWNKCNEDDRREQRYKNGHKNSDKIEKYN